MKVTINYY